MTIFKKNSYLLISFFLILSLIIPVQAESPMEKAKEVKGQIAGMKGDLAKAFDAHERGVDKLDKLNRKLASNTVKLKRTAIQLKKNQKLLSKRINNMYRYRDVSLLDILFSAHSFNEMLVNLDFISRVSRQDARIIAKVKRLRREVAFTQKRLVADRAYQKRIVRNLKEKKNYIQGKLSKAKKMLKGLDKEIAELSKPKPLPAQVIEQIIPSNAPAAASNGQYSFPVGSPYSFSNDWGAPRKGHSHQGNDILAPMGTPAYAVIGGNVSNTSGGSAGLWQILNGDDGNVYWYMHMKGFAASGRVSTGQVIGYVGNTGNASGGPSHVHFELHPGGGGAVNPYYFLTSIQ